MIGGELVCMIGGELGDIPPWEHFGRIVGEPACILPWEFACTPALAPSDSFAWVRSGIPLLGLAWRLVSGSSCKTVFQPSWVLFWALVGILVWGHCGTLPLEPVGILPLGHSCTAALVSAWEHYGILGEARSCTPAWELAWELVHTFLQELAWELALEFLCTPACQLCYKPALVPAWTPAWGPADTLAWEHSCTPAWAPAWGYSCTPVWVHSGILVLAHSGTLALAHSGNFPWGPAYTE